MTGKVDSAFSQELNQMEKLKTSESEQIKTKELLSQIEARLKEVEQSTADLKKRTVEYFERIDRQKKELENPNRLINWSKIDWFTITILSLTLGIPTILVVIGRSITKK